MIKNNFHSVTYVRMVRFGFSLMFAVLTALSSVSHAEILQDSHDRLVIFFRDTAQYDSTRSLRQCLEYERPPITVRASNDFNTVNTERSTEFTIELSEGLSLFETMTSEEPLTSGKLENGEVILWLEASKEVADGEISLRSNDADVADGHRGAIHLDRCFPYVIQASFHADNGFGSVNRLELQYESELSEYEMPDSVYLFWPDTSGEKRRVYNTSMELDSLNPHYVTVALPNPFPREITRFITSNTALGTWYWNNPLTPEVISPFSTTFAIYDSVGPLLTSAILIERLKVGDDSLLLTFTEEVSPECMSGQSLLLVKDGSSAQLNVLSAIRYENDVHVLAICENAREISPAAGDSLRINPFGSVVDVEGNRAHEFNRPVVLQLSTAAPEIIDASYTDTDGNGIVDLLRIGFKKNINPSQILINCEFESALMDDFVVPSDIKRIDKRGGYFYEVDIDGIFNQEEIRDRTSGAFIVYVAFAEYPDDTTTAVVMDSAAPVLKEVRYHMGRKYENDISAPDTLFVTYSEEVAALTFLQFENITGEVYDLDINTPEQVGEDIRFIVMGLPGYPVAGEGDSVWINAARGDAVDKFGNVQKYPENKKVALQIFTGSDTGTASDTEDIKDSNETAVDSADCGCGTGTSLALFPPLFYYYRGKVKRKRNKRKSDDTASI